jgi:hypothetical protein
MIEIMTNVTDKEQGMFLYNEQRMFFYNYTIIKKYNHYITGQIAYFDQKGSATQLFLEKNW